MSDFFYKVRKGLGHFGAFLVLGIFSTFTWLLFFTKKKMFFSVPINIILGFGIVQFGLSLKSHDPSQRANSVLTIGGGIIITFAKEILGIITGG